MLWALQNRTAERLFLLVYKRKQARGIRLPSKPGRIWISSQQNCLLEFIAKLLERLFWECCAVHWDRIWKPASRPSLNIVNIPAQLNWNFTGLLTTFFSKEYTRFNFMLTFVIINCFFEREYVGIKVSLLMCMTNKLPHSMSVSRVAQTRVCSSNEINRYLRAILWFRHCGTSDGAEVQYT